MLKNSFTPVVFLLLFAATSSAVEYDSPSLVLERFGVMFVGGQEVEMPASGRFGGGGKQTQIAGQAPVHYLIPPADRREGKRPVIMVPGMGLTSYLYLSTPDGRDGWAQTFAKAGYPVYVFDEPYNAISGFEVGKFTDSDQPPRIMLWSNEITWRRWGIGPEPGVPAENTRYPFKHIDQLHASMTPVMGGSSPRGGGGGIRFGRRVRGSRDGVEASSPKVDALVELLEKVGPATLVLHSASGLTGFEAVRRKRELVNAIVAVEVTGSPTDADDIEKHFEKTQFIGVYGDNFDLRPMSGRLEASQELADGLNAAGGKGEVIWLPNFGIKGNSHLLMQDNNNHQIAQMIIERLQK